MPAFFASVARAVRQVLRELLVGGEDRDVFAPAPWPALKKPSDQLEASFHGALLNHMSCCTFAFTWNEKLPISSRPRCLTSGMIGAVGTVP